MKRGEVIEVMIAEQDASVRLDPGMRRKLPARCLRDADVDRSRMSGTPEEDLRRKRLREAGGAGD
jgi:hypothetical protein